MKFLLDTEHVTIIQYGNSTKYSTFKAYTDRYLPGDIAHSVISFQEQVGGAFKEINASRPEVMMKGYGRLQKILNYYAPETVLPLTVLPFDPPAAQEFDRLRARGIHDKMVKTMDLRIASIALSRGLTVLTSDVRHFGKVPGLVTEDWLR